MRLRFWAILRGMNIPPVRTAISTRRIGPLLLAAALLFPASALGQDAGSAPAGGAAETGSTASGGSTSSEPSGSGTAGASGTASATTSTSTTASSGSGTASAHASSEGAAGTASPAGHPHSPPAGAGVGEEPEPPCTDAPTFDPSTPRFELQAGGGGGVFFLTWRQSSDSFMAQPMDAPAEGLYSGGLFRGEVAFAFGGVSLSAIYTHLFLNRDGGAPAGLRGSSELGLVSGEIGVQCACRGSVYVWSFGIEIGGDVINGPRSTIFASIEHRSMFYLWEGLFVGFDVDIATFIGMSMGGPSGGGILGSVFLGYSFG